MTEAEILGILLGFGALVVAIYAVLDSRRKFDKLDKKAGTNIRLSQPGKDVTAYPPGFKKEDYPLDYAASINEPPVSINEGRNAVLNSEDLNRRKEKE